MDKNSIVDLLVLNINDKIRIKEELNMISIIKTDLTERKDGNSYFTGELRGLSTDTKPTEIDGKKIGNGSVFIEIDTQNLYFYDLASQTWKGV